MSKLAGGFDMGEMLNIAPLRGGGDMCEPVVEQLTVKLKRLQQDKKALEEDIQRIKSVSDSLQKELATVQSEYYQLEGIHKEKEELFRKLQFQCEESEQESARLLNLIKKGEELLEQCKCEIQEFKLKHRKLRMKFENQLYQLIEQQKSLHSVFTPQRLAAEIEGAENTKNQLLSAEKLKLAQLWSLEEELDKVKQGSRAGVQD
ncbi:synaptonemal complex central element protein 1 [Sphaeramia orbicularis]|uniref:synaptonemal complex central element protein 1 n=1 Tax=Sphaeramia orbicularis TaxID=375764 RepID=UPI00117EDFEC|nr:synaptonemal complex central element protein 1 [Sphaeramia orbicularis]